MDKVYWLKPGRLAGRSGPDQDRWDLDELRAGGIGAVLTVNDGMACEPAAFAAADIEHALIPFSNQAPPGPGDDAICLDALPRAYDFAAGAIERGRAVMVHCTAGKDRTGMFLAYFLMRADGLERGDAMARVREVRPIAFSAIGWEPFTASVLERCTW